jgi:hypothetical protein
MGFADWTEVMVAAGKWVAGLQKASQLEEVPRMSMLSKGCRRGRRLVPYICSAERETDTSRYVVEECWQAAESEGSRL